MNNNIIGIICASLIMLGTHACVSDLNLEIPNATPRPVLNCILQNDSTIEVSLNWSGDIDTEYFEPIVDVQFALSENDKLVYADFQYQANHVYKSNYTIKKNCSYKLIASLLDGTELVAKTISPIKPNIMLEDISTPNDMSRPRSSTYAVKVQPLDKSISALYLYIYPWQRQWDYETGEEIGGSYRHDFPFCNSPFADSFNAYLYEGGPTGFFYLYDYFVRIDAEYLRNEEVTINIAPWNSSSSKQLIKVIAANNDYDKYFKSSYVQRSFDPEINLPFTYYPVPVPSNVEGGLGQMSAVDIQEFVFETSTN